MFTVNNAALCWDFVSKSTKKTSQSQKKNDKIKIGKSHMVLHSFDNIQARQIFWSQETGISLCCGVSLWFSPSISAQDSFLSVVVLAPDSGTSGLSLCWITECTTITKPKPHTYVPKCDNKSSNRSVQLNLDSLSYYCSCILQLVGFILRRFQPAPTTKSRNEACRVKHRGHSRRSPNDEGNTEVFAKTRTLPSNH